MTIIAPLWFEVVPLVTSFYVEFVWRIILFLFGVNEVRLVVLVEIYQLIE